MRNSLFAFFFMQKKMRVNLNELKSEMASAMLMQNSGAYWESHPKRLLHTLCYTTSPHHPPMHAEVQSCSLGEDESLPDRSQH